MTKKDIGLKIKNIRLKAGLTQKKLSKKVNPGIRIETISRIEKGKYNYTIDMLFKIAEALNCDISDFFETTGEVKIAITKDNLEALQHLAGMFKKIMKME